LSVWGRNAIAGMRGCSAPEGGVRGQYHTISAQRPCVNAIAYIC